MQIRFVYHHIFWTLVIIYLKVLVFSFLVFSILSLLLLAVFPDLEILTFCSVNYICISVYYIFILDISEILDNIYVWVFSVNGKRVLLSTLVKYMLCSHFTQNRIFLYFLEAILFVGSCPTRHWIAFLMLYRLVFNIRSHFKELTLAWSAYYMCLFS